MGYRGHVPVVPATRVATSQCAITSEYQAELASEWLGSHVPGGQLIWDGFWTEQRVCRLAAGGARRSKPKRPACTCVALCEAAEGLFVINKGKLILRVSV